MAARVLLDTSIRRAGLASGAGASRPLLRTVLSGWPCGNPPEPGDELDAKDGLA